MSISRSDKLKAEIVLKSGRRITTVGEWVDLANQSGTLFVDYTPLSLKEWQDYQEAGRQQHEAEEYQYDHH